MKEKQSRIQLDTEKRQHSIGREKVLGAKARRGNWACRVVEVVILKRYTKPKLPNNTTVDSALWQIETAALAIGSAASKLAQSCHTLKAL